jgi:hypothetical protein
MPIRPENRGRYPADWSDISARIRFERAGGRCECDGRCGLSHEGGRCDARHGFPHPLTGSRVVLTTAHVHGTTPEQCDDELLFAACQLCHNRYDAPMRAAGRAERRAAAKEEERRKVRDKAGQLAFEVACFGKAGAAS